jgi:hypothetical protein
LRDGCARFVVRHEEQAPGWWRSGVDHRLWVITEADRSATTILWPEEY